MGRRVQNCSSRGNWAVAHLRETRSRQRTSKRIAGRRVARNDAVKVHDYQDSRKGGRDYSWGVPVSRVRLAIAIGDANVYAIRHVRSTSQPAAADAPVHRSDVCELRRSISTQLVIISM